MTKEDKSKAHALWAISGFVVFDKYGLAPGVFGARDAAEDRKRCADDDCPNCAPHRVIDLAAVGDVMRAAVAALPMLAPGDQYTPESSEYIQLRAALGRVNKTHAPDKG